MSTLFPPLFKKSSTGAIQEWVISVNDNVITTAWGQLTGAIQTTTDVIKEGKNLGKKNETTPEEQALSEAQSRWEKQLKKGYVKTLQEAESGTVDEIIEGGVAPMLAHDFSKQGHKVKYPALVQPKFDGHRCIAVIKDGKATLWSRTRKPITGLPHIVMALEEMVAKTNWSELVLDGELYNHDYKDNFEDLTSFIRNPEPKAGCEAVEYHIYDVANSVNVQYYRHKTLEGLSGLFGYELKAVETVQVESEEHMMEVFESFLAKGYEGLMVRNMEGQYVNKRSYDLQKVKEFDDAEFPIVGVEEGRGKLAGHAVFVCKTEDGTEFRVKLKGDQEILRRHFENPCNSVGRMLTVKYQGITGKNGVPRFPVGVRIREDI